MPNFGEMTLKELVRPEGHACGCGKQHVCGLKYLNIGRGILKEVPEMVAAMGKTHPFGLKSASARQKRQSFL